MRYVVVVLALLVASGASAQLCPDGASGRPPPGEASSPSGYCAPRRCTQDSQCGAQEHCGQVAMCIGTLVATNGQHVETAWSTCERGMCQQAGERCERATFCVAGPPPARPPTPPPTGIPPLTCPEGAVPRLVMGMPACVPVECTSDASCGMARVCVERALCVSAADPSPDGPGAVRTTQSACDARGRCRYGNACVHLHVCVPRRPPPAHPPAGPAASS